MLKDPYRANDVYIKRTKHQLPSLVFNILLTW